MKDRRRKMRGKRVKDEVEGRDCIDEGKYKKRVGEKRIFLGSRGKNRRRKKKGNNDG